ncbi:MAG: polyisoprenoid-binding protein [Bacteroidetes bacterium 43-16]|nr:MAG: polyisoprenoid-binding protein [Bacteroidetes bacterium 43-16]
MKKIIITLAMIAAATQWASAQKYMTRTGKVSFFSSTSMENIEAFNNESAAVLDSKNGDLVFQIPIKSFKFEKALMQEHFNENYMESDKFPKSEFKGKIDNLSTVNFSKDGTYPVTVSGNMTIHGVTKRVQTKGNIKVAGNSVTLNAKFNVAPADYGIKIPSMAAKKVASSIEVTVASILKAI